MSTDPYPILIFIDDHSIAFFGECCQSDDSCPSPSQEPSQEDASEDVMPHHYQDGNSHEESANEYSLAEGCEVCAHNLYTSHRSGEYLLYYETFSTGAYLQ